MGIIIGLLIFATGCFLFIPAANTQLYPFFLIALFIIACGLTTLETAANPYITIIGEPETASRRLNFAQSFNGLATIVAPVIGAKLILTRSYTDLQLRSMTAIARKTALASEASSVKLPYLILALVLITVAFCFHMAKLPTVAKASSHIVKSQGILSAFRHRHLSWAVAAQFFYVGAQVCVFSLFILYASKSADITETQAAVYLGEGCGVAFVIGRFAGTAIMRFMNSNILLGIYAIVNVLLCFAAILLHGIVTVYVVMAICFFMSIMFPTIFALGIKGLGKDTAFGSSLIIMSIVGGAIIPRIFGYISDVTGNIQYGYVVPLVCFSVIAVFGLSGHKPKIGKEILPMSTVL